MAAAIRTGGTRTWSDDEPEEDAGQATPMMAQATIEARTKRSYPEERPGRGSQT